MGTDTEAPNHHADHPGFSGLRGLVGAISMAFGREETAAFARELVALAPGDQLVDIGCGPGAAACRAAALGAEVVGIDPAAVMLRVDRGAGDDVRPVL